MLTALILLTLSKLWRDRRTLSRNKWDWLVGFFSRRPRRTGQGTALSLGQSIGLVLSSPNDLAGCHIPAVVDLRSMAQSLAVRRRFLLCVGAAARLFPAGVAALDSKNGCGYCRLPEYSTPPPASHLLGHQIGSRLGPILIAALLYARWLSHGACAIHRPPQWNSH